MADLLIVTKKGSVKRTDIKEYQHHHRATEGVIGIRLRDKDEVAGMVRVERASQSLMVVTNKGTVLRFRASEVPRMGRRTKGVIALRLGRGERVESVVAL